MFRYRIVSIIFITIFMLQACDRNIQADINKISTSIESKGINIHRLKNMSEIPIDSYIEGVTTKMNSSETVGILKVLSDEEYLKSLEITGEAIARYPANILLSDLDTIYLGGRMQTAREQFTTGFMLPQKRDIYLFSTVHNDVPEQNPMELKGTVHHELSSILMRKYRFDMIGFMSHNSSEIEYWHEEAKILENPSAGYYATGSLLEGGLLTNYSQTSPENDFNMYVEVIFVDPFKMTRFCSSNERIKNKYEFVKAFYLKISPDFQPVFDRISC